jgi:CheY-like chemotaxis protein
VPFNGLQYEGRTVDFGDLPFDPALGIQRLRITQGVNHELIEEMDGTGILSSDDALPAVIANYTKDPQIKIVSNSEGVTLTYSDLRLVESAARMLVVAEVEPASSETAVERGTQHSRARCLHRGRRARRMIVSALGQLHRSPEEFASAKDLVAGLEVDKPKLIFLDGALDGSDAIDVIRRLDVAGYWRRTIDERSRPDLTLREHRRDFHPRSWVRRSSTLSNDESSQSPRKKGYEESDKILRPKDLGLAARKLPRLFFIAGSQAIEGSSCLIVIDRDSKTAATPRLLAKHCRAFARGHVDQHIDGADEPTLGIKKRRRKRHEVQSRTIGALGDGGDAPYRRLL